MFVDGGSALSAASKSTMLASRNQLFKSLHHLLPYSTPQTLKLQVLWIQHEHIELRVLSYNPCLVHNLTSINLDGFRPQFCCRNLLLSSSESMPKISKLLGGVSKRILVNSFLRSPLMFFLRYSSLWFVLAKGSAMFGVVAATCCMYSVCSFTHSVAHPTRTTCIVASDL